MIISSFLKLPDTRCLAGFSRNKGTSDFFGLAYCEHNLCFIWLHIQCHEFYSRCVCLYMECVRRRGEVQLYRTPFSMWMQNNFCFWLDTRQSVCVVKKRLKTEFWQRHRKSKIFNFRSLALSHLLVHLFSPFIPFSGFLWWAIQLNIFSPICLFRLGFFCIFLTIWAASRLKVGLMLWGWIYQPQDNFSLTAVKLCRLPAQPST